MYHIFYVTINKSNGKRYYGKHSTDNIKDGYLGSGTAIENAIKKYGESNFERIDLAFFETSDLAYEFEGLVVDESIVNDPNTYNIKKGGFGGFDHINGSNHEYYINKARETWNAKSDEEKMEINAKKVRLGEFNGMYGTTWSTERRDNINKGVRAFYDSNPGYKKGEKKTYTEEGYAKWRESLIKAANKEERIAAIKLRNSKTYKFMKDGEVVYITNLTEYCRDHGLNVGCMTHVFKGRNKQHKGYTRYEQVDEGEI